jgi:hypothetical protein
LVKYWEIIADKAQRRRLEFGLGFGLIHILMGIVCIGLLPKAEAVVPAPDGGYPGFTTAEGAG